MSNTVHYSSVAVREIQQSAIENFEAGSSLINRSYLAELGRFPIASPTQHVLLSRATDMRIFKVERIVQNNKQSVLESTTAAYTALGAAGYTVFLYLHSDGAETDLFIGTRGEPGDMLGQNSGELLRETFKGHFSGSSLQSLNFTEADELLERLCAEKNNPAASITSVTGVPALSTENREHFMQGLERFIDAAENRKYQALILAEPVSSRNLDLIRSGYEQVATQLSPLVKQQLTYGEQDSENIGLSITQNLSTSLGHSLGLTETRGTSHTTGTSSSETHGTNESLSSQTTGSKIASISASVIGLVGGGVVGGILGTSIATAFSKQKTTGTSYSETRGSSESVGASSSTSTASTKSSTQTSGTSDSQSIGRTSGSNRQLSIETVDKTVEQLLVRIDHHLQRIDEAKTYGGWNSAAYFIGDSQASSESLASVFLGLIRGTKSSHEDFALTTWTSTKKSAVLDWLSELRHPELKPAFSHNIPVRFVTPATLVSGKEMAIQLSLPRRSTSTVSVVEAHAFGRKIQRLDGNGGLGEDSLKLTLGNIRHLWENLPQTLELDMNQLSSHVFVSGSTGAGKSNTLYGILSQVSAAGIPFLVIEPAKGEYKHVFGHRDDVSVFGTNPAHSDLLRINPFRFPAEIHVLEHIDRLIEIFNVCWPMYAAMPAVLKEATLQAYQRCGWDLESSNNRYSEELFPTFMDLLETLQEVIGSSAYSADVQGNYIGSLSTRIKSLTNGLNGQLFSADEIDNNILFDSNVIVDLSRVGSSETKALIMGILVMRLSEHRMAQGGMNKPLQHVTVLEEAHNILKRSSEGGAEGANLVGKSVEMLTNAIAEMRTYGEGFIIVDQSPHAVDLAAIRNTNTKIIMRLPEEADRRLLGKSAALNDEQLDEIARLPKGVAIVYQNDWLEPVLCQINEFEGSISDYKYQLNPESQPLHRQCFNAELINFLLLKRVFISGKVDSALLRKGISKIPLTVKTKITLLNALEEYQSSKPVDLWKDEHFNQLSKLLVDVLGCRNEIEKHIKSVSDMEQLTLCFNELLNANVSNINRELALAVQQCFMKDFTEISKGEHALSIYALWRNYHESRKVQ